jgi:hypothetical protein
MLEKIKKFFEFSSKEGLYLPMAHDAIRGKPSVTLLVFYVGLILSTISLIAFHFRPETLLQPTLATLVFLSMGFVFYRMRSLDRIKFDLDDKSIELGGGEENVKKEGNESRVE